jgi:alpha-amylase
MLPENMVILRVGSNRQSISHQRRAASKAIPAQPPAARKSRRRTVRLSGSRSPCISPLRSRPAAEPVVERYCGRPNEVLLQGFHWQSCKTKWRAENPLSWYEILRQNAARIRAAGFTFVWFPPPCPATWPDGEGYEPTRWHCFDSSYGTETELRAAIGELLGSDGTGPKALADVVINHRCGTADWGDFSEPHFAGPGRHSPEQIARANFAAIAPDDEWRRRHDSNLADVAVQSGYEQTNAGRHLNHDNPIVATEVKKWLRDYLRDSLGFAGFRYDLATGYPAHCVGQYNDHARPELSVGEVWREDPDELFQWVCGTQARSGLPNYCAGRPLGKSAAFDFALRAKLWDALRQDHFAVLRTAGGKLPGLVGLWPDAAVTFVDNHDTEPVRGNGKAFPADKILAGYAYILTHPGKPTVFWSHFFDYGEDEFQQSFEAVISRMIAIRSQNGIHSASRCRIVAAERSLYAAVIDDRVAVKIGSSLAWRPGPGWPPDPVCWGKDFAIWTRLGPAA